MKPFGQPVTEIFDFEEGSRFAALTVCSLVFGGHAGPKRNIPSCCWRGHEYCDIPNIQPFLLEERSTLAAYLSMC